MRRTALALGVVMLVGPAAGCVDDRTPRWQLDYDRVLAVRATPPQVLPGETALLDALVARADASPEEVAPLGASAAFAPAGLFVAVHFNLDHWEINGPDEAKLDQARAELGLEAGAPVPLEVTVQLPGPLYATKTVWLGTSGTNPDVPIVETDGIPAGVTLEVGLGDTSISTTPADRVRWFTSCGELSDDDRPVATLRVERACSGELAVVVRDAQGGIGWRVLAMDAR